LRGGIKGAFLSGRQENNDQAVPMATEESQRSATTDDVIVGMRGNDENRFFTQLLERIAWATYAGRFFLYPSSRVRGYQSENQHKQSNAQIARPCNHRSEAPALIEEENVFRTAF
jgi:hypothetical protein